MKKGFTLLELIIVVIIIGVLASLALPQYFKVVEKARVAEAVSILSVLRGSQVRYYTEWANYTTNQDSLDANFSTGKFFSITPINTGGNIARATRNTSGLTGDFGAYNLSIDANGTMTCTNSTKNECPKLGY